MRVKERGNSIIKNGLWEVAGQLYRERRLGFRRNRERGGVRAEGD